MLRTTLALAGLLAYSLGAQAQESPNIEPGLWETTSKIVFSDDLPLPDQNNTNERCMTQEDFDEGLAFFENMDGCEFTRRDINKNQMDFEMICEQPDGRQMTAAGTMQFDGNHTSATMNASIESQLGPIDMTIEMTSNRLRDC